MSKSIGIAHIIRHDDGSVSGVRGPHALRSAFQPIFAFQSGKLQVAAYEALIRPFRDTEPVAPAAFFDSIDAAERLDVETLTRTLHLLNAALFLPSEAAVFINFDPSLFVDRSISRHTLRDMRKVLNDAGIDPCRIVCEITEKKPASEEALFDFVNTLKTAGFRVAVDDFGSDDSDIKRIKDIQPDIVKFDAHWISRLMESGAGFALLREMVSSFEQKGIRTVFEGLEHGWQLQLAERSGASMVQGFALALPQIIPASFTCFEPALPDAVARQRTRIATSAQPASPAGRTQRSGRNFGKRTLS